MPLGLTKYGLRELFIATMLAAALWTLAALGLRSRPWAFWPLAAVVGLLWGWVLAFFRDPRRTPPEDRALLVSPADGRVADITNLGPESVLGCEGVQIGVFMSIFNVHVNRSPCDGRVEQILHRPGTFLDVRDPDAFERNESTTIRLACPFGAAERTIVVRQVAGLIARRIVTDLAVGQTISRSQRIGMIKFGSRLEVLVPREMVGELRVAVGQRVWAGRTALIAVKEP